MADTELPPLPEDVVEMLNASKGGFNDTLGLTFTHASYDEVVAELEITPALHQPYGLVHGGVYCAMIETLASVGAALHAMAHGRSTVGLDNSTSFLRGVREGKLVARATPLSKGRRAPVWQVSISDDQGREVANGRVRTLTMEDGASLAGEKIGLRVETNRQES